MAHQITLRNPSSSRTASPTISYPSLDLHPPPPSWLAGTWHVTHSTLPMWKSKRNVRITYTPLPLPRPSMQNSAASNGTTPPLPSLNDLVTYQSLTGKKTNSIHGVDTPASSSIIATSPSKGNEAVGWVYHWYGKGWLRFVGKSTWEVLGWGDALEGSNQWVVTYFSPTLFTPAGIDVYSRHSSGLGEEMVRGIKDTLARSNDEGVRALAKQIFSIRHD